MYRIKEKIKSTKIGKVLFLANSYLKGTEASRYLDSYYDMGKDIMIFEKTGNGEKNTNKNICYIYINDGISGFFATWKYVVERLTYVEKYNLTPVVEWGKDCPYYDKDFKETTNPFEYYFHQMSDISVDDVKNSSNVLMSTDRNVIKNLRFEYENCDINALAYYTKKYFKIREDIIEQIEKEVRDLFSQNTIAVHVRGVEWGNVNGHPIPVGITEYMDELDKAIKEQGFNKIFLATDSEETVSIFNEKYGDTIFYFDDVSRAKAGSKKLAIFDNEEDSKPLHRYRLGYEVLRDMYVMSKCNGLIAGFSNISVASMAFKEARGEKFIYKFIIQNKIQTKGIASNKIVSKIKKEK